jgi:hypothetical protein
VSSNARVARKHGPNAFLMYTLMNFFWDEEALHRRYPGHVNENAVIFGTQLPAPGSVQSDFRAMDIKSLCQSCMAER